MGPDVCECSKQLISTLKKTWTLLRTQSKQKPGCFMIIPSSCVKYVANWTLFGHYLAMVRSNICPRAVRTMAKCWLRNVQNLTLGSHRSRPIQRTRFGRGTHRLPSPPTGPDRFRTFLFSLCLYIIRLASQPLIIVLAQRLNFQSHEIWVRCWDLGIPPSQHYEKGNVQNRSETATDSNPSNRPGPVGAECRISEVFQPASSRCSDGP